jgi:hypothetical protein
MIVMMKAVAALVLVQTQTTSPQAHTQYDHHNYHHKPYPPMVVFFFNDDGLRFMVGLGISSSSCSRTTVSALGGRTLPIATLQSSCSVLKMAKDRVDHTFWSSGGLVVMGVRNAGKVQRYKDG